MRVVKSKLPLLDFLILLHTRIWVAPGTERATVESESSEESGSVWAFRCGVLAKVITILVTPECQPICPLPFLLKFLSHEKTSRFLHTALWSVKAAFWGGKSSVWVKRKRREVSMEMLPLAGIRKSSHDLHKET